LSNFIEISINQHVVESLPLNYKNCHGLETLGYPVFFHGVYGFVSNEERREARSGNPLDAPRWQRSLHAPTFIGSQKHAPRGERWEWNKQKNG